MGVKVISFVYQKGDKRSHRYALFCGKDWAGREDMVVLDITREIEAEIRKDARKGHDPDVGPCFGFAVYNATKCGVAHVEVTERWRQAGGHDSVRPRIGYPGMWRIYKTAGMNILREWAIDV